MSCRGCATIPNAKSHADQSSRFPGRAIRALAAAVLCLSLFVSPAAAQWAAPNLFPAPPVPTRAGPHGPEGLTGVMDASPVLRGLGRLRLHLPGGGAVQMKRDGFERRRDGDVTWRGRIAGEEDSRVILTFKNGYVAGRIFRGLDEYEIRPGPGRSHVIERVDGNSVFEDEHAEPPVDYSYDPSPGNTGTSPPPPYTNSPDNIQLLALYTPKALAAAGGEPQIEVRIQSMVDQANAAFINSGMIARISLVRAEKVAYDEPAGVEWALHWLIGMNPDNTYNFGALGISAKREFFGADLVSMIVDNEGQCGGAAFVMTEPDHSFVPYAYNVSALSCGSGTLAHEIGHNMGFEHNPEDSSRWNSPDPWVQPSYPWSFGHYVDGAFRTIMSYPTPCLSGCPKALQFSNPDISFLGSPTGIVDARDNARTGDLTAPIVTNFMDAVVGAMVNRRIAASVEDVEELADGTVVLDSATLELGGVQAVGLRFENVHIPPGMRIDSAYLEFEAADLGSTATNVEIRAEAADNAAPFSPIPFDVTGRPATLASVPWEIPAWDTVMEKHYSPDISAIIQELVDRPGWLENNSLVITVDGIGLRSALAHDGDAAAAPLLHVEYASPDRPETIEAPVAAFSYSCTGLTCTFTDESTDADGTIVFVYWYFGSPLSATSFERNPVITFPADGSYFVSLDVQDDQGWPGTIQKTINVHAANTAPVATDNAYTTDQDVAVSGNVLTDGTPDSDGDGDPFAVTANTSPLNGTLTITADGAFTYTPSAGFAGSDSFTYTIGDNNGGSGTATVTITVNALNRAPVATDNAYTTSEEVAVSGNVLTDGVPDSDPEGDPITVTAITGPSSGSLTITADGDFNYYPDTNFFGSDSYSYTVSDGNGGTATATVTITVNPVSDMPVASANDYTTDEDIALNGNVITDGTPDSDADGDTLTVSANTSPLNGTLTVAADGAFTYMPATEFSGSDSFTYTVSDGTGLSATATVTITVNLINDIPVATDNAYTVDEDGVLLGDVINDGIPDSDADGDKLIVDTHTRPMFGTLVVGVLDIENNVLRRTWGFGDFTYTPNAEFHGTDSFDYTVKDPVGNTATATVTITVNPVNDVPVAAYRFSCVDLTCGFTDESLDKDGAITSWSWNFGDGATSTLQNPSHTYAADGIYTITLTVTDDGGATDTTSQSVHVMVGNTSPLASDNAYVTYEEIAVIGNLLTDGTADSDADGDALTVTANTSPLNGTLTVAPNGTFTYNPDPVFNGSDSFNYTAGDGNGGSDTATVTITVISVNDVPVATDNAYTTDEDVAFSGNVRTDGIPDSDADSDTLGVTAYSQPLPGRVTVGGDGYFTYYPAKDHSGVVSFDYTVSDGDGGSDTATVTITVNPVNDPPVSSFYFNCTGADCTFTNNSRDVEGPVTWLWDFGDGTTSTVERPSHSYAAIGLYTVTLTVTDDEGATATSSRVVGNQTPVATNNVYTLDEDTTVSGNFLLDGTPDSDPDGDPLTFSAQTWELSGTISIDADGSFIYTPVPNSPASLYDFPVSDSFTYSISDGKGGFDSATVTFWINPVNDVPVAGASYYCYSLRCTFLDRSTDVEGPIASWSWDSGDGATYATQNPTHQYADYGTYTVTLTVTDGGGLTDTVTKTLNNPNIAPVATDDYYTTTVDTPITGNVRTDGTPDSDGNGDSLSITLNNSLLSGEVSMSISGYFTYTPAAGFVGRESFTYTASDRFGGSDTAIVTIRVDEADAPNTAPAATANAYTTDEDVAVGGNVLLDETPDSDADGDALSVTASSDPTSGAVTVAANGAFTYTPNADFNGTDTFAYTIDDGRGGTATATVAITVNPVNDAPVAIYDGYVTDEDIAVSGNVLTDGTPDSDPENDPLTVTANSDPLHGTVTMAANGAFTYTPAAGFYGIDRFTYTIGDGNGGSAWTGVSISVNLVNSAPVATANTYETVEDTPVSGNALTDGVPDSDVDGDTITITEKTDPLHGSVLLASDGTFAYTPNADFNGTDSFAYTVSDGVATATANVSITVSPVNDAPVATDNAYTTAEDTAVSGNVLLDSTPDSDADGDALTVTANTSPLNGTVTVAANGAFTYTPNADFNGSDGFTYTVSDGNGGTATATASITVNPVNDGPVAAFSETCTDLSCVFTDASTDIEGAIASWAWSFGDGATSVSQNPTHDYAADGTYTVSLTATDGQGATDIVSQTVTVANAANTAPVATNDAYTVDEDSAVSGNLLTDGVPDSDADGDALTVTANTNPTSGTITVAANGAFTYTPNADFNGTDSFTYTVSDGIATATATVSVAVTAVNDAPVATADSYATAEDVAVSGNVLTDGTPDSDADGDALTVAANTSPLSGTVTVAASGAFTYTPNADFNGTDSFTYTVSDGIATATATVTVTVSPVNDAPVAAFSHGCTGLDCAFTDGSTDVEGVIASWSWSFGDGAVSSVQNPTHGYAADGAYTVSLTVTDGEGATGTVSQAVTVANTAPVATDDAYTTAEDTAFSGNVLTDGTPDSDGDGDALTVTANTNPLNGTVTVAANGAFTYTPTADFNGADSFGYTISDGTTTASATVTITVSPVNDPPVAAFSENCTDLSCAFFDGSTDIDGTIVSWNWSFHFDEPLPPDQSTEQNPSYIFPSVNEYLVSLTVTDSNGASAEASKYIVINIENYPPVAGFAYNCSGLSCSFMDISTDAEGAISGWSWDFGDGATSTVQFPEHDYAAGGSYPVTLTVTDAGGKTGTTTQTLTVNSPPVATANVYTTSEDIALSGNVLTDGVADSDADGDTLTVTSNTNPTFGTVTVAANGAFTYTPSADFNGSDSFDYTISDGNGGTATATVSVTVTPVNDAPVAAFSNSCAGLNCSFTDGSTDTEGAISAWAWSFGDGAVSAAQNPVHRYAADGTYTVSLTVTDNQGATDTVSQAVTATNTAPVATADAYTTNEDAAVSGNVLTDGTPDSDADGDSLAVTASTAPLNGTVTIAASGAFTYTPNADFNGTDSFAYTLSDGIATAAATVTVTVIPLNDAPVATANAYTSAEDTAVSGNVLTDGTPDSDVDGDTLTVTASTSPLNGTVAVAANGAFTYTPNADFNGSDRFDYEASDGFASTTATVTITIIPVNDTPVATANTYTVDEDTAVSGNVLTDGTPDSDIDGDTLTVTANTNPLNGTLTIAASGAFTYTPNADFNGTDSFTYTVSDETATATAAVSITVSPVNDAPVAAFSHGCAGLNCAFTDGSADTEGAIASWSWSFGDGTVSTAQNAAHSYAADGTYTVTLTVTDGEGATAAATQTLTVANTPPVATDNAYTTDEDVAVSGNVLTDGVPDSDPDGDTLTVLDTTAPLGTLLIDADGSFTYLPPPNFSGTDSFGYSIVDGISGGATATVTITVNPVNDVPVAAFTHDCLGRACTFSDSSSDVEGPVAAWAWDFGDGAVSTVRNPAHSYAADGTYTVTLTVTDGEGATDTVSNAVIAVNTAPVATANAYTTNEDTAVSGNVLTDGTPDSDADGDALTVSANTDPLNGAATVAANGAFTYTPNADFNGSDSFTYTIGDGNGGAATATVSITVTPVNDGPVASFGSACTDLDCAFTDGSTDIDGTIVAWSWDFGDGATSAVQSPTHGYVAVDGTYTVTLTVTDDQGATDTTAQSVTVTNPFPPAAPANLSAAVTSSGNGSKAILSVTLSWTDTAINEESFIIERCEIQGGGGNATCVFAPVAEVGADTTAYAEDLAMGSYRYRIKARNRNGDSGYSNVFEILKQQV